MKSRIAVIGLWHLGEVYSVCLAEIGHTVVGIDENEETIRNLGKDIAPLPEPKLAELLASNRATGRLSYSSDFSKVGECDTVWITLDTPVNERDEAELDVVWSAVDRIAPELADGALLIVSSQIPVGTSEKIVDRIKEMRPGLSFEYAYSPENLRLGDAVACFMHPERVVVGAERPEASEKVKEILAPLHTELLVMSPASAEMAKHALNACLAASISFANDIADLCETYGADAGEVFAALKSDPRIGQKAYLFPGLGFSGGTLGRDLNAMLAAADARGVSLPVIDSVLAKNRSRAEIVPARLTKELGSLKGKTLALFGVTYKPGTPTLRRSQPLEIEKLLREAGAAVRLYDPLAKSKDVAAVTPSYFSNDPEDAADGADALLIMTPWKEFRDLDFRSLRSRMEGGILFDTCNILSEKKEAIAAAGYTYLCVGR